LGKDSVNYRVNRMKKLGVIKNFHIVLNTPQLGFMHFSTLFRFRNMNEIIKNNFINFMRGHEKVIWCVSCYGAWDFSVSFLAKNILEYDDFINGILGKFGKNIHEKSMSMIINSPTYTRGYLLGNGRGKEFDYKISKFSEIDEMDHKILSLISQRANMNVVDVAGTLKTTVDVVRYRIKQMEMKNIIQGFRISIDLEKIGYLYYKILFNLLNIIINQTLRYYFFL